MSTDLTPAPTDATTGPVNPLLQESTLPYQLPDFASVTPELLRDALEEGIARQAEAWEAIAASTEVADVANTVEALAHAEVELDRATALLFTFAGSGVGPEYGDLRTEYRARLAEHQDGFWLDERMYRRFQSLERAQPLLDLPPDITHFVRTTCQKFRRGGIGLDAASRGALRDLNAHLAGLEADFSQRVTRAGEENAVHVTDVAELAGLDEDTLAALKDSDANNGDAASTYTIALLNTTQQPLTTQLTDAEMRADLLAASTSRCGQQPFGEPVRATRSSHAGGAIDDPTDTRATLLEIARLRAVRAELLGFPNHAAVVAAGNDAGSTDAIDALLTRIAGPARAQADAEIETLRALDGAPAELRPSDLTHLYARRRKAAADLDDDALRPYLELWNVVEHGMFHAATLLYGITFSERTDLAGYAEGVRVWEVFDHDGSGLGLFVGDFYTRSGKQGGAWMHSLVDQSRLLGTRPVICNNSNFRRPAPGAPTLLTWDEVRTCFHEFGHALHGLLSDVYLPQQAGTSVQRDTVEFPSQVNEIWQSHPAVLPNFAVHHQTGQTLPAELLEKVEAAEQVNRGFGIVEHAAAVLLDQGWHRLSADEVPEDPAEVDRMEAELLAKAGLDHPLIPPRYRTTYFRHTFGGGYDAGYYSYLWAEQLDADTVDWFRQVAARDGDLGLNRAAGDKFRQEILSRGGTRTVSDSFHALRGRDVRPEPLLKRQGLLD